MPAAGTVVQMTGRAITVTVANGATDSETVDLGAGGLSKGYRRWDVTILGPPTVTATLNVQLAALAAGPWSTLQSGGSDIVLPTGGKATVLIPLVARFLRIHGTAQGQDSIFTLLFSTITDH